MISQNLNAVKKVRMIDVEEFWNSIRIFLLTISCCRFEEKILIDKVYYEEEKQGTIVMGYLCRTSVTQEAAYAPFGTRHFYISVV